MPRSTCKARNRRLSPRAFCVRQAIGERIGRGLVAGLGNFDVRTERQASGLVVAPRGEIDLATVGRVREAVESEHQTGDAVVIDLREVGFMDTSGLRYILELSERGRTEGFALRIVRGPSAVQRVFEVSGVAPRLAFVDDPSQDAAPGD